jgi:hypothetical protein
MKLKTTQTHEVEVTIEEVVALLTKLVEKKSGKKVDTVNVPESARGASIVFNLISDIEEKNLDEGK